MSETAIINPEMRHLFFPTIITNVLIILVALILLTQWKKIISTLINTKNRWKDLEIVKNKKIFLLNLVLLFGYVVLLELVSFIPASLIYIFLTILLFYNTVNKRTIITAGIISCSVTAFIWVLFGFLLNITLP